MAWTWIYSSSYNFGGYKEYRAFLGYDQVNYSTYTRCWYSIGVEMRYGYVWGVTAIASGSGSGSCEGYLSNNPKGTWTTVCRKDNYFDVTRTTSSQTRTVTCTAKGKTVNGIGSAGGSGVSKSHTYTIPALASYTVTYNANGGSGAPGNQIKYYGKTLTLSTTKPTRTGYTFDGWYTAASGGSKYGTTYTTNAAATLYAHWTAITYNITYNLNDSSLPNKPESTASDVPPTGKKTYGVNSTISSIIPERPYYKFKGWATSATGDVVYPAGATYSTNANLSLYAVWEDYWYHVEYDTNLPEGEEIEPGVDLPEPTYYDLNLLDSDVYHVDSGASFVLVSSNYFIYSFKVNDIEYGLDTTYIPKVGERITFVAFWVESYMQPTINSFQKGLIDKYGKLSLGGRPFYLKFTAIPAKGPEEVEPGETELVNRETIFSIKWSTDRENWLVDSDEFRYWSNNPTIDESGNFLTSEQQTYERIIDEEDKTTHKYYKILLEDKNPYYKTVSTFDENKTYYTYEGEGIGYQPVAEPNAENIDSYYEKYEEYSYEEIGEIPDRNIEQSFHDISISNLKCSREDPSHTTVIFSFNWQPYYDGYENYISKTEFYLEALPYVIIDEEPKYYQPIPLKQEVVLEEEQEEYYFEGDFSGDKGIPVDLNAEIWLRSTISINEDGLSSQERPLNIKIKEINLGGFPVHINEKGTGISLFGIADNLNGFEVNAPTMINNTLKIKDLALGQSMTSSEMKSFLDSLNIASGTPKKMEEADWIVEQGYEDIWFWRKWNSGIAECWGTVPARDYTFSSSYGHVYYTYYETSLPSQLFASVTEGFSSRIPGGTGNGLIVTSINILTPTTIRYFIWNDYTSTMTLNLKVSLSVKGRWK